MQEIRGTNSAVSSYVAAQTVTFCSNKKANTRVRILLVHMGMLLDGVRGSVQVKRVCQHFIVITNSVKKFQQTNFSSILGYSQLGKR